MCFEVVTCRSRCICRKKKLKLQANDALHAVHGSEYVTGCLACVLYVASGTAVDWAYGGADIKYSYTIELRDTGEYGFVLPPDQIIPTAVA